MFDVHFDGIFWKVVAEALINNEADALWIGAVMRPGSCEKCPGSLRIDDFVIRTVDHEDGTGEDGVDVENGVDLGKERFGFGPETSAFTFPEVVFVPAFEPLAVCTSADKSHDGGKSFFVRSNGEARNAGGRAADPAEFSDVIAFLQFVDDATGVFDGALGALDVTVGETLIEIEPLRTARGIVFGRVISAEGSKHVAFVEKIGAPTRDVV